MGSFRGKCRRFEFVGRERRPVQCDLTFTDAAEWVAHMRKVHHQRKGADVPARPVLPVKLGFRAGPSVVPVSCPCSEWRVGHADH